MNISEYQGMENIRAQTKSSTNETNVRNQIYAHKCVV